MTEDKSSDINFKKGENRIIKKMTFFHSIKVKLKKINVENIIFIFFILVTIIIFYFILSDKIFLFPKLYLDLHKYLLSALIQSLSTVLALGITLTIISIQFTGQVFSSKTYNLLFKSFYFWFFIFYYILIIAFCILLLANSANLSRKYLILGINLTIVFTIFAFLFLIPYVLAIFKILNSKELIKKLLKKIKAKHLSHPRFALIGEDQFFEPPRAISIELYEDPIYPIYEIINNSVHKDAINDVYIGIENVNNKAMSFIESIKDYENSFHVFGNFSRYYVKFIDFIPRFSDKEFSQYLIYKFSELFEKALEKKNKAICNLILSITQIAVREDTKVNREHNIFDIMQDLIDMGVSSEKEKAKNLINQCIEIIFELFSNYKEIVKEALDTYVYGDPEYSDRVTIQAFRNFKKKVYEKANKKI